MQEAVAGRTAGPPRELRHLRGRHAGATIIVCGCGRSLKDLPEPQRWLTIGVNDVGRLFDPTYLVVVNPKSQFAADRFRYVAESRAQALFTQLDARQLGIDHPRTVRFRLGRRGGTELDAADALPFTRNSPYVAVCLAAFMGAKRIGLIGVDFTDHHFFGQTGRHGLTRELAAIDREYGALGSALARRGVELVNLSRESRLTSLPRSTPVEFLEDSAPTAVAMPDISAEERTAAPLAIVSYATTPVAGVPPILSRCIAARTSHAARCVWADRGYGNGVTFEGDVEWNRAPREAEALLRAADVVIVHNGKVAPQHETLIAGKAIVTMAHNYLWNVNTRFVDRGCPGLVVGQYQATLPEFAAWTAIPNPVPLWEAAFSPEPKPSTITVCYTPSGRHERYPQGHRLYWHGKGYDTTMRVLERLAAEEGIALEVIRATQISHAESLAMKRRAHIVIDECVTGSYHRNTLEGLAAGCVVVNAVGLLDGVEDVFRACGGGATRQPCVFSRLEDLEQTLRTLIAMGAEQLQATGRANREWMEQHWEFGAQWDRFWRPAIESALPQRAPAHLALVGTPREAIVQPARDRAGERVSVVVPHGGAERLPHLSAVLATLRQQAAVAEVIVAEMGERPIAEEVARRTADKYVFIQSDGPFERARALNAGSALAEHPLVLWHDNDLITTPGFVARAAGELAARRLDYLVPYTAVHYLSEADSPGVMDGSRRPADCRPVRTLYSGRRTPGCSGGIGLVSREFLMRYGGLIEGFRGWGGEDNAWNVKVRLLGRWAATSFGNQHAYHVYHASSAGYPGHSPAASNPNYCDNVALLQRVQRTRSAQEFLREFPVSAHPTCTSDPAAPAVPTATADGRSYIRSDSMPEFHNVFACLVHENQECVIDLVRNLRYMDPGSTVLLYNGGRDPSLLTRRFPFDEYGAIVHPSPRPLSWGRLHDFALDCMRYAIDHFRFDALTIVDSDQLAVRCGYSDFIAPIFRASPRLGLLGSSAIVQPRNTRVGPVVAAYRELPLWEPLLSRYPQGTRQFGRWTFWPSTVFSAAAAHDLTHMFATDEQLQEIMRRSQIWASEEVIFPMLLGLLGYEVTASPCSYEFVKHRVAYGTRDVDRALTRSNVFWIHPINRKYDDRLRAHIRNRFNHYERSVRPGGSMSILPTDRAARPLFLLSPILTRMRTIEGWLDDDEAEVLAAAAVRALEELPAPHAIVEIGSYCGRSTVVLGSAAQAHRADARVYAIDPHDGVVGALDQGLQSGPSTLGRFQKNVADAELQDVVVTIQRRSFDVAWSQPVSLLFIDGLHDYANVSRDFHHFEPHVVPGGYVAFHDYASYYPGVKAFVNELLASAGYEQVVCVRSMMLLRKRASVRTSEPRSAADLVAAAATTEQQRATA
jgi:predicted O-methyltransferase YrrM